MRLKFQGLNLCGHYIVFASRDDIMQCIVYDIDIQVYIYLNIYIYYIYIYIYITIDI